MRAIYLCCRAIVGRDPLLTNGYVFLWETETCKQILPTLLLLFPFSLSRKSCLLVISLLCSNALKHFNISVCMGNIISIFSKFLKTYHQPQDIFFRLWLVLLMSRANKTIQKNSFDKLHLCLLWHIKNASWLSQISCWFEIFVKNTLHRVLNVSIISQQSIANPQCFSIKLMIGCKPGRLLRLIRTSSQSNPWNYKLEMFVAVQGWLSPHLFFFFK